MLATLTSNGQITIPKQARNALQLDTGDRVEFIIDDDGRLFILPVTRSVKTLKGMLQKPASPVSLEEMDEAIAQAVSSWSEQPGVISHIVLCELVWVLSRAYQYSREQVAEVIHAVLTCQEFLVERVDLAELAFLYYQQGNANFSDYLLARRQQQMGAEYTVTFDSEAAGAVRMMAMTDFWLIRE